MTTSLALIRLKKDNRGGQHRDNHHEERWRPQALASVSFPFSGSQVIKENLHTVRIPAETNIIPDWPQAAGAFFRRWGFLFEPPARLRKQPVKAGEKRIRKEPDWKKAGS
jgi:hypothetical protein